MTTPKTAIGTIGPLTPCTHASDTANTSTPATAESPASTSIADVTSAPSVTPARRIATTRAAGVHTPPGTYFASIDTISARKRDRVRDVDAPVVEDAHPPDDEHEVVRGDRDAPEHEVHGVGVAQVLSRGVERAADGPPDGAEEDREQRELRGDHEPRMRLRVPAKRC